MKHEESGMRYEIAIPNEGVRKFCLDLFAIYPIPDRVAPATAIICEQRIAKSEGPILKDEGSGMRSEVLFRY